MQNEDGARLDVVAIVPAYRAASTIVRVVADALTYVDRVIVVDDACPEGSGQHVREAFAGDARVRVITHGTNKGVGGAVKTGFKAVLTAGPALIVKLDADDQMDARYIPAFVALLERFPAIGFVKGNRFASASVLRRMPRLRLIGNSGLSFLVKACTGFWNLVDPTNGYIVCRSEIFEDIDLGLLANRYFFEIDLLCALGLRRIPIAELQMDAKYDGENSSLSIGRALLTFPAALLARYAKRLFVQYIVADINVGSLYALAGFPLLLLGTAFGLYQWALSTETHLPRTSGTVILALLLFITGFQLMLQALAYDVSESTQTLKARIRGNELIVADTEPPVAAFARI